MDLNQILVILLLILIILVIFLIFKISTINHVSYRLEEIEQQSDKQNETTITINEKMNHIGEALNLLLKESNQSQVNINHIVERVNDMNNIMINKKTRGNFGEYQLYNLLSIYAGESSQIYETQYLLKNGYIGDVAMHLPNSDKVLIIDSKFPIENYQRLSQNNLTESSINRYQTLFRGDIKKHINDISKKYINAQTVEHAVMFIPSEAIYYYICKECDELITYAHSKHILLTSPTTLLGVVFTFIDITKDVNRTKNIKALEKDIVLMYEDTLRLSQRMDNLGKAIEKVDSSYKTIQVSTQKIISKIEKIHDGYSDEE